MFSDIVKPGFTREPSVHSQLCPIKECHALDPLFWMMEPCFLPPLKQGFHISGWACEDAPQNHLAPFSSVPKRKGSYPTKSQVCAVTFHSMPAPELLQTSPQSQINWLPCRKLRRKKESKALIDFPVTVSWTEAQQLSPAPGVASGGDAEAEWWDVCEMGMPWGTLQPR